MYSGKNKTNVQNGKCTLKIKYIEYIYTYLYNNKEQIHWTYLYIEATFGIINVKIYK